MSRSDPQPARGQTFTFSGSSDGTGVGWDDYRELYGWGAELFQEGAYFRADITALRLDGVLLFERRLHGIRHERNEERVLQTGFDHHIFQWTLAGVVEFDVNGSFQSLRPGESVLLDAGRVLRMRFADAHLFTASIAKDLANAAASEGSHHGRRILPERTRNLRDFWSRLSPSGLGGITAAEQAQLVVNLLSALAPEGERTPAEARRRLSLIRRALVRDYVDANLARRDLDADGVAAAAGMSRATLYRLMAPHGGIASYIRKHRLAKLERLLAAGDGRRLSELADHLGFADASHMSRQFRAVAGVSPGHYRVDDDSDATAGRRRWAVWMEELR
jgi:AraC-like DNA-binding protein